MRPLMLLLAGACLTVLPVLHRLRYRLRARFLTRNVARIGYLVAAGPDAEARSR